MVFVDEKLPNKTFRKYKTDFVGGKCQTLSIDKTPYLYLRLKRLPTIYDKQIEHFICVWQDLNLHTSLYLVGDNFNLFITRIAVGKAKSVDTLR